MKTAGITTAVCCVAITLLVGCAAAAPMPTATAVPPPTPVSTPTPEPVPTFASGPIASSVEFVLEIRGDPNPLNAVRGLALDTQGNLYAVDAGNNRVQKFDPDGRFLAMWGSEGDGDGEFRFADFDTPLFFGDIAVDAKGLAYVVDTLNNRIQTFDSEGQFLSEWGELGHADGQFQSPSGVTIDAMGHVYVPDGVRGDVQKFDSDGRFLGKWSGVAGNFARPEVDAQGNVYVGYRYITAVLLQRFDAEGNLVRDWATQGRGPGEFLGVEGVTVDSQGSIYVADCQANQVQKLDRDGKHVVSWGRPGAGQGEFRCPTGIAVDGDGNVYVGDGENRRIQKFRQY